MTIAPDTPPRAFADVGAALDCLRAGGLRLSTPRRLVLQALFATDGPVSAAHLARTLSLDESSVYRNLELLESRGVVRHLHLGHSPGLYVLAGEDDTEYLYCERCAKVTPVSPAQLSPVHEAIARDFHFTARFTHFALVGLCEDCGAPPPDRGPAAHLHSHGGYVHAHAADGGHAH
jgi:Fur family ferric uptake transcriptional regulator